MQTFSIRAMSVRFCLVLFLSAPQLSFSQESVDLSGFTGKWVTEWDYSFDNCSSGWELDGFEINNEGFSYNWGGGCGGVNYLREGNTLKVSAGCMNVEAVFQQMKDVIQLVGIDVAVWNGQTMRRCPDEWSAR